MTSILKSLRLAADPNRLRILLLLQREELSVAELQEILSKGQSHISTHLAQLLTLQSDQIHPIKIDITGGRFI